MKGITKESASCQQITETYGSSSVNNVYVLTSRECGRIDVIKTSAHKATDWRTIKQFFRSAFLPQGYPESVSEDYLQYQIYDTLQAFSSGITGSLATQSVLKGVGVGDETATVLAATVTWLLKDGVSMVGGILFAWKQSSYLDCDCKRWRLFADIVNDISIFLDIIASHFTQYFRVIVCVSGLCRALVGVAGGATRAALTQHQARRNNMADVSAKDGSQETLVNLAALICSLIIIPLVSDNPQLVWLLYVLFTALHLYANYSAVRSVYMETFNQSRLHLVVHSSLLHQYSRDVKLSSSPLLSVRDANYLEPVLCSTKKKLRIRLGCQLNELANLQISLSEILSVFDKSRYLLSIDVRKGRVNIVLHKDSEYIDQLQACYHAEVLEYCYTATSEHVKNDFRLNSTISALRKGEMLKAVRESFAYVKADWLRFCEEAKSVRWKLHPVQLCADEWRSDWTL